MLEIEDINVIKLSDPLDMQEIFYLRNEIFVKEQGYTEEELYTPADNASSHFLLLINQKPAGCISVFIDQNDEPLPLEQYVELSKHKGERNAEVYKLALLPKYRNTEQWMYLVGNVYFFLKTQQVQKVFISVQGDRKDLLDFYTKLGFKKLMTFKNQHNSSDQVMATDLQSAKLKVIAKKLIQTRPMLGFVLKA